MSPGLIFGLTALVIVYGSLEGLFGVDYGSGFGELSVATLWSVLLLGMTSRVCFHIAALRSGTGADGTRGPRFFWRFVAFSFAFLAVDDALQVHENLDKLVHQIAGLSETALTDRLDDVIVLGYALAGAIFLLTYRDELERVPGTIGRLAIAFALALVSAAFDVLTNRSEYLDWMGLQGQLRQMVDWAATVIEEGAKLLAGATLLLTFTRIREVYRTAPASSPS